MLRVLILSTLLVAALAAKSYDGYKIFSITPQNKEQLETLNRLESIIGQDVDFWKSPHDVGSPVVIMVSPEQRGRFLRLLDGHQLPVEITTENLQRDIDAERDSISAGFDLTDFNTLADINSWMNGLPTRYPDLVTVVKVGDSYEGRDIWALKIGKGQSSTSVWYEGGIHAREWISPATIIYMTDLLLTRYGTDADVTKILDELHVYMLPVFNVDGYEFTWTDDRMWRKTRSDNDWSTCKGADPNRNWDYQWGYESNFPCSDTYHGSSAFSEIEVRTVADYILKLGNVKAFIDFHSFGLMWMSPWGYTYDYPPDYNEQVQLANEATSALQALYGTEFATGSIAEVIYAASGSSADWTYQEAGIKYSYGVELRGSSFVIHRNQIEPSGLETFEALKVISLRVIDESK
ncbi:carboxypeptidase B-like [Diadema antillarum]|uniref:carboxypeptidase B-like n=1 Tax=Diadema antillarum TaxID=105358 RepID=UPI003A87B980